MSRTKSNGTYSLNTILFENHKVPQFKEVHGQEFIWNGEKNNYPQYLLELAYRSAKHNAILVGKAQMIKGQGFEKIGQLNQILTLWNNYDNVDALLYRLALDLEMFGALCLEITFGMVGGNIVSVSHMDYSKIRLNKDCTLAQWCEDWEQPYRKEKKTYNVWNEGCEKKGTYLYYYKEYRPSVQVYGIPEYVGAVGAIETDIEITNFHLNNIKQGFAAGMMVNFNNGVPNNAEKQREIERKLKAKFQGTDNAGGVVINFSDSPERKPDILPLQPSTLDKQFEQLRNDTTQEIFIGHKITSPMLFGVRVEGQLGGRNEIIEAFELFQNTYVAYKQKVLEEVFNYLAKINGLPPVFKIVPLSKPLSLSFSEQTLVSVMTPDEIRAEIGLKPLNQPTEGGEVTEGMTKEVNENLKRLSGRETQNLMRIVRNYDKGKITKEQALLLIMNGFGLNEEEALTFLGEPLEVEMNINLTKEEIRVLQLLDKAPMLDDLQLSVLVNRPIEEVKPMINRLKELALINEILIAGEYRRLLSEAGEKYAELYAGDFAAEEMNDERKVQIFEAFGTKFENKQLFAADLSNLDKSILAAIKGNKRLDMDAVAKGSRVDVGEVNERLAGLIEQGYVKVKEVKSYGFPENEYSVTAKGNSALKDYDVKKIEVFYAYKKRPDVDGRAVMPTTREFCREMMRITDTSKSTFRLFSRQDINQLSSVLGYNVWEQRGGYYNNPKEGVTPYCRHEFYPVKIVR